MAATSFLALLQPLRELAPAETESDDTLAARQEEAREAARQAQVMLAQARAGADTLLEDARIQAEALREAAWQEGFHHGQQTARQEVEVRLRADWDSERAEFRDHIQAFIAEIGQAREALWERQEAEMVAFVLDIARQVIKTEVTQNPEIVCLVLRNALRRVTDKENIRIRVSVADADRVKGMREELLAILDGLKHLEIVDDRRVGDGGCVIETNAGTIDAKIETQLAEVERVLNIEPL